MSVDRRRVFRAPPPVFRRAARVWIWAAPVALACGLSADLLFVSPLGVRSHGWVMIWVTHIVFLAITVPVGWRAKRRIHRLVATHAGAVCLHCAYPLRTNLQEGVCPECGEAYEIDHTRAMWRYWINWSGS